MKSGYEISLEPPAELDFKRMSPPVQAGVARAILRLAESPSRAATRPSTIPYPPGQVFQATFGTGGVECLLDVVFQYSQDEQTLSVSRIFVEHR